MLDTSSSSRKKQGVKPPLTYVHVVDLVQMTFVEFRNLHLSSVQKSHVEKSCASGCVKFLSDVNELSCLATEVLLNHVLKPIRCEHATLSCIALS